MVSPKVLEGPRLKIKRAERHIDELRQLTDPLHRSLYEIVTTYSHGTAIDRHAKGARLVYRPKQPIPQVLAIIIGDAVHNLRSALDHLARGIITSLDDPPKDTYFPMHPERKNLVADRSLAAIEQALPGAKKAFLKKVRPENGHHETTWRFNALDNIDKHNLIIPAVTVAGIFGVNIRQNGQVIMKDCGILGDAAGEIGILSSDSPILISDDLKTAVEIRFGKGGHSFENEPVIPTLLQIRDLATKTVNIFEALINQRS